MKEYTKHPICVNQIEISPLSSDEETIDYCQKSGIIVTAYAPLATAES